MFKQYPAYQIPFNFFSARSTRSWSTSVLRIYMEPVFGRFDNPSYDTTVLNSNEYTEPKHWSVTKFRSVHFTL